MYISYMNETWIPKYKAHVPDTNGIAFMIHKYINTSLASSTAHKNNHI